MKLPLDIKKNISEDKCKICGLELFREPLLSYENMPMISQHLPDLESIKDDKGIDLKIYQCSGCGMAQLNNEPVSYYKEVIRAVAFSPEMKEFRIKQFNDFTRKYSLEGKKVIEIGCGRGEYMSIMSQVGADIYGLEYSDASVNQCVKNGLNISGGVICHA